MKKTQLVVCLMLLLLSVSQIARGKPLSMPITGPMTACIGDVKSYSVSPGVPGHHYYWSVTAGGNVVSGNPNNPSSIQWVAIGPSTITVQEKDDSGNVVNTGTYGVTVYAVPHPFITTDSRVACQKYDSTGNDSLRDGPNGSNNYVLDDADGCPKVCEHSYVTYYAHSTTGGSGPWLWTVTGGTITSGTPTSSTITVQWGPAGPGHITLTETNAGSCTGTSSICIDIINRPMASFCVEPFTTPQPYYSACIGATLVFHDLSTAGTGSGITTWHWDFGDGVTSSLPNPTHSYSSPGGFNVTLVVTNACGCTDSFSAWVRVDQLTGPDIQCPAVVCEGETSTYSTSVSGCGSYDWNVIGGTIIAGAGSQNIIVQWGTGDASGYGYVNLDVSSCGAICPGTTSIKVPIIQSNPFVTRPTDPVCTNQPYQFGIPVWPSTQYHWGVVGYSGWVVSGVDNNISTIQFPVAGTYTVHVWYQNSLTFCGGDVKFTVTAMDPPTISGDLSACVDPVLPHLYTLSTGMSGDWTLNGPGGYVLTGSGPTFSGVFPVPGSYTLSVEGTTFCPPNAITIKVTDIPSAPNTISGPTQVCFGSPYTYQVTAPLAGTVFNWYVVPASAATLSSTSGNEVTVEWSAPGTIYVDRVSVVNPSCSSPALSIPVTQFPINPVVTGPSDVCANGTYAFSDGYSIADATTWKIITNDLGSVTSGEYNPSMNALFHDVSAITSATVQVTVKKCGINVVASTTVNVHPAPIVSITGPTSAICGSTVVTLSATSGATTYTWDFGDGTTAVGNPVYHTYHVPHTSTSTMSFVASVTASGSTGACPPTGTGTYTVDVIPGPYASISTPDQLVWCTGTTPSVTLYSVVTNNLGTPTYTWYNSTGSIGTGTSITVSSAGDYYLVITDMSGCSYTSNVIHVIQNSCSGTSGTGCSGPAITMSTTVSCGHIIATVSAPGSGSGSWDATAGYTSLTTGGTGTTYTADVAYSAPGFYNVTFFASYPGGCLSSTTNTVAIPVIAHYYTTWDCSTSPYALHLHDISDVLATVMPVSLSWNVSGTGGGTSTDPNPTFTSLSSGSHTITLTASTMAGSGISAGSCTITGVVDVPDVTTVSFTPTHSDICEGIHIAFPMSVSGAALTDWTWDYGDGATNSDIPGERNYSWGTAGSFPFNVTLTGHNTIGCPVSATNMVNIWHNGMHGIVSLPSYVACGGSTTLSYGVTAGSTPVSYTWSNGPTTMTDPVSVTGNYFVTVTDVHSCQFISDPNHVAIINSTPPTIYGDNSYCAGNSVILGGYVGVGYTYKWYKDGSLIPGATTENLVDPDFAPGTHVYQIEATSPAFMGGPPCSAMSAPYTVTIYALPLPPVISGPTVISCPSYQLQLTATGVPGTFNWSSGTPGVGPTDVVDHGGGVRCWLTDVHGCVSHADVSVPNSPDSYKDWFPIGCYTYCRDVVQGMGAIKLYGPPGVFNSWDWMMGGSPMMGGGPGTITPLTIPVDGNYELTLDNGLCSATFGDMQVSLTDCQCQRLIVNANVDCDWNPNNPHGYIVTINMVNPYGFPIDINFGMDIGPMIPFTVSLPPGGGGVYTFNFTTLAMTPPPTATVWAMYNVPWGTCTDNFVVDLPPCSWQPEKPGGNASNDAVIGATGMLVYPNPAGQMVNVNYVYSSEGDADRSIAIYDVVGRKVAEQKVTGMKGSVSLSLANLAAGAYLVRMDENGKAVHVQHLSVTH